MENKELTQREQKIKCLRDYGRAIRAVKRLSKELQEMKANPYPKVRLNTGGRSFGTDDLSGKMVREEDKQKQIQELIQKQTDIRTWVDTLTDEDQWSVVVIRYLHPNRKVTPYRVIAAEMRCSERTAKRAHEEALEKLPNPHFF